MLKKHNGILYKKQINGKDVYLFPKTFNEAYLYHIAIFENDEEYRELKFTLQEKETMLKIGELDVPRGERKGNGRLLIEMLFEVIAQYFPNVVEIYGNLSPDDNDHLGEQKAFYKKMGFEVEGYIVFKKF